MSRKPAQDWAGDWRSYLVVWGVPNLMIVLGAFTESISRTYIWIFALAWMGFACLLNARRCNRTHCRFTGPFYLFLILPVAVHGLEMFYLGDIAWWILGIVTLLGGKIIWLVTEAIWGRYRSTSAESL